MAQGRGRGRKRNLPGPQVAFVVQERPLGERGSHATLPLLQGIYTYIQGLLPLNLNSI